MKISDKNSALLELAEELMKDKPQKQKVKRLMLLCGMVYNSDYLDQISTVINSLSKPSKKLTKKQITAQA